MGEQFQYCFAFDLKTSRDPMDRGFASVLETGSRISRVGTHLQPNEVVWPSRHLGGIFGHDDCEEGKDSMVLK